MEELASAVLEYGPLKFPVKLFGFRDEVKGEVYEYGVASSPDGIKGYQAADYRSDLMAIANGRLNFGIKNLFIEGEPLPEAGV